MLKRNHRGQIDVFRKISKGAFINTLVGGGLGKMEGGQKSFELPEGGDQKVFRSKGGVKKV